jgi:hypothetical protein
MTGLIRQQVPVLSTGAPAFPRRGTADLRQVTEAGILSVMPQDASYGLIC